MNILVICHYGIYKDFTASFVHNQVKKYVVLGHRVRVVIPIALGKARDDTRLDMPIVRKVKDNVEIFYIRFLSLSNWGNKIDFNTKSAMISIKLTLTRLVKDFVPDIIHAHTLGLDSEIGSWIKEKIQCPLVVTTHGSDTSILFRQGERERLKKYCDKADVVVGVSSILVEMLKKCGTYASLKVIHNGFETKNIISTRKKIPYSFIQVGNLIPQKKTDITIRAFAEIVKNYSQAYLVVVGDGPERENLEQLCRKLKIEKSVQFKGKISNSLVLELMADAKFFIMPSVCEGFGIVYLEAMASGCITIGTQGEGISDLIEDGRNGFLVPPDNSEAIFKIVKECIQNELLETNISRKGKDSAKNMTWEVNAKRYVELFQTLL